MSANYTLSALSTSALADGTTGAMVYNPTLFALGGASPNKHALIRFDGSSIPATEIIVAAELQLIAQGKAGTAPDVTVWASEFGAGITYADYGLTASNANGTVRVQLSTSASPAFSGTSSVAEDVATVIIPSRFVGKAVAGGRQYGDFELRPGATTTVGNTFTVYGTAWAGKAPLLSITTITYNENDAGTAYRWQVVGAETYLGFDIETTEGVAVKAKTLLDVSNNSLQGDPENLVGNALSRNRARPLKVAVGKATAGGSFSFDVTPEKCWRLLVGIMKLTATADNGDGTYTHTFKVAQSNEIKTFTFVSKAGPFRFVYPGTVVSSINFSTGLDRIVTADASVISLFEYMYDYQAAGTNDEQLLSGTAAYDSATNGLLSFVGSDVQFNGVVDRGLVRDFNVSINQDAEARRGLARRRGATSHAVMGFTASLSFSMYFESENRLRTFLGINDTDFPTGAEKSILFENVILTCRGADEDNQVYEFEFPKVMYTTISKGINSEGAIELACNGVAVYDESSSSNVIIRVTNTEPASVFAVSTDTINVLPNASIK